jgi:hypothetical protein
VPHTTPGLSFLPLQSRDHADRDAVALGDRGQRLAGTAALDGFGALVVRQLALATELNTVGHGPLAAVTGALADYHVYAK